jgi:hemerythrin-like domain-containing protein
MADEVRTAARVDRVPCGPAIPLANRGGYQMSGTTPVEVLEAEHRVIQRVVAGMAVLVERLDGGQDLDVPLLENIVEFLSTFADRRHRGVPSHGCPIGGLTMEHQKGRVMVGELADAIRGYAAGEPPSRENLVRGLRALVALYPNHIWKEDYLLFPLACEVLTPEDQQDLMHKFDTVDREPGLDVHEGFDQAAAELERTVSGVET